MNSLFTLLEEHFVPKVEQGLDKGRINYGSTDYSIIKENVLTYSKLH
ncbi:MAG: hypothetical protein PHY74_01050 [Candidatus Bathyarchaeota archaeon]|nr:hypothetical protein [Candidatus Bathyarchaeota archaeon]MDD4326043.1 hypothetical protein [Candidatus Bathyarchaeota archaeon]MDI9577155.1 hypothetical protein [Thermoproteota archaeon]MDT8782406.1 hypothetical protein [Candidatus Bathyarchaeota archaeon]NLD65800.1 hypothetical protein [Thermoproteota archaeon]